MKVMTPKLMNKVLGYVAEKESDIRNGPYRRQILWHDVSYRLRHNIQRRVLKAWASNEHLQEEYENPFDYLNRIECERWDNADEDKRKRIFRIVDKWELIINEKYEFFRQFLDDKEDS